MLAHFREAWQFLKRSPPGERFRLYHAHRQEQRRHAWQRPLLLTGGTLIVIVGIILMPAPGPGTLIVAAGAALLAGESKTVANTLDAGERAVRRLLARWWR